MGRLTIEDDVQTGVRGFLESTIVKMASTAIMGLLVPFGIWSASTIQTMNVSIAELKTQMSERTSDRYTGSDARRDISSILGLIERNRQDIGAIAIRQSEMERLIYTRTPAPPK